MNALTGSAEGTPWGVVGGARPPDSELLLSSWMTTISMRRWAEGPRRSYSRAVARKRSSMWPSRAWTRHKWPGYAAEASASLHAMLIALSSGPKRGVHHAQTAAPQHAEVLQLVCYSQPCMAHLGVRYRRQPAHTVGARQATAGVGHQGGTRRPGLVLWWLSHALLLLPRSLVWISWQASTTCTRRASCTAT